MKKLLTLSMMLMVAVLVQAQLKVIEQGHGESV